MQRQIPLKPNEFWTLCIGSSHWRIRFGKLDNKGFHPWASSSTINMFAGKRYHDSPHVAFVSFLTTKVVGLYAPMGIRYSASRYLLFKSLEFCFADCCLISGKEAELLETMQLVRNSGFSWKNDWFTDAIFPKQAVPADKLTMQTYVRFNDHDLSMYLSGLFSQARSQHC